MLLSGIHWAEKCVHSISGITDVSWMHQLIAVVGIQVREILDLPEQEIGKNRCVGAL